MDSLDKLREVVSDLTPGGIARRAASNAAPVAPLFVFLAITAFVAAVAVAFSENTALQFVLAAAFLLMLALSVGIFLFCLVRRRDLLRSENYDLEIRNFEIRKESHLPEGKKGEGLNALDADSAPATDAQGRGDSP